MTQKEIFNGRKRYFNIDENVSSEQRYALLDDVESADQDDIGNLMNDFDTEFIAEKEITQAASTQDTSLTKLIFTQYQVTISQRRKKRAKKNNYGSEPKK